MLLARFLSSPEEPIRGRGGRHLTGLNQSKVAKGCTWPAYPFMDNSRYPVANPIMSWKFWIAKKGPFTKHWYSSLSPPRARGTTDGRFSAVSIFSFSLCSSSSLIRNNYLRCISTSNLRLSLLLLGAVHILRKPNFRYSRPSLPCVSLFGIG